MNKISILLLLTTSSFQAFCQTSLLFNVNGYTLNASSDYQKLKQFHAVQFTNDKIDKVFVKGEKLPVNTEINKIDGQGKTLLPGLIDAHGHVLGYGLSLLRVKLFDATSEYDAVKHVIEYSKNNTQLTWLLGRGWNQENWQNKQFPTAKSLDKYFPDTPVWLRRVDGHAGWANSKAMELAGITMATKAPAGGEIIRTKNGQPTGVFVDNAMNLIESAIAPLTLDEQKSALIKSMNSLASMGLTSVHDAGIYSMTVDAYQSLASQNKLSTRINAMYDITENDWQSFLANGHLATADQMFTLNSIKISSDGALGSRGAALIHDYSDKKGHKGLMLHTPEKLSQYMQVAMKHGFQVNTHAIGDKANMLVLDLYKEHIKQSNTKQLRHRIEHAQVLRIEDIIRFNQIGVIASMQATHATSDKNMAEDRVGPVRILGAYAWRKLLDSKAVIAAGSDFPIESPNPFFGMHAAVTRQDHKNLPEGGWYADEKMTRVEAFKSFTYDAAFAGHQEQVIGSIEKGKKADFILVSDDLFTVKKQDIWKNKVLATWVNGQRVYQSASHFKD